jgi:hypothetical protein
MTFNRRDAWTLARVVSGLEVNGELQAVSSPLQGIAHHLATLGTDDRPIALDGFLAGTPDGDKIAQAIDASDPEGPPPEAEPPDIEATLEDVQEIMSESQWIWESWIASERLAGIAAFEGVGKTRFAMDLARRVWFGLPWPDKKPATFPKGTRTLWACSDGQQGDLVQIAKDFGMPLNSVRLATTRSDPYGAADLDDAEWLGRLERSIAWERPGIVFIDTLTNATSKDLCRADDVKDLTGPLRDLAQGMQLPIILQMHLSREGHALGRRIKGRLGTIMHLECPDPHRSERLKLYVSKSFARKPPALGVTMSDRGNDYDPDPPEAPEGSKGGRPSDRRDEVKRFIRDALNRENGQTGTSLRDRWHEAECERSKKLGKKAGDTNKTFHRAVESMKKDGELTEDGGPGTGRQWTLSLTSPDLGPDHPF